MARSTSTKRRHHTKARQNGRSFSKICSAAGGKVCFTSRKRALTKMNFVRSQRENEGRSAPIDVYRCQHCGDWHMTSKEQRA